MLRRTSLSGPMTFASIGAGAVLGAVVWALTPVSLWMIPAAALAGFMLASAHVRRQQPAERSFAIFVAAGAPAVVAVGLSIWLALCLLLVVVAYWVVLALHER